MNTEAAQRPQKMPGKTAIGLTALWAVNAYLLFASVSFWKDLADHGGLDELNEAMFPILLSASTLLNLIVAVAIHRRQDWARKTAIVLGVLGIVIGFISFGTEILTALGLILVNGLVVAMIASERTEEWCDR